MPTARHFLRFHAGAEFAPSKKFNGLSLCGAGNGTKADNISLLNGSDDGIKLYGVQS